MTTCNKAHKIKMANGVRYKQLHSTYNYRWTTIAAATTTFLHSSAGQYGHQRLCWVSWRSGFLSKTSILLKTFFKSYC